MISLLSIGIVLVAHFIGDWLLQFSWMRHNKSKDMVPLGIHAIILFLVLLWAGTLIFDSTWAAFVWAWFNSATHFWIDAISSRWAGYHFMRKSQSTFHEHMFISVVGLDQLLHYVLYFWSYEVLA